MSFILRALNFELDWFNVQECQVWVTLILYDSRNKNTESFGDIFYSYHNTLSVLDKKAVKQNIWNAVLFLKRGIDKYLNLFLWKIPFPYFKIIILPKLNFFKSKYWLEIRPTRYWY